jgi:hypothetical protein
MLASACVGNEPAVEAPSAELTTEVSALGEGPQQQADTSRTGVVLNGVVLNGVLAQGLAMSGPAGHGLVTGGLSDATLARPAFAAWAATYPEADVDRLMHYLVACAVPQGKRRTWTSPASGLAYTWEGILGLAPSWAEGKPATETEQQLTSACLAAMVNKYGVHVLISVRGRDGAGKALEPSAEEKALFTVREAAFFGNLFSGEGVYACHDRSVLSPGESSPRACGIASQASGMSAECPPLQHVGICPSLCRGAPGQAAYERCTVNGKDYAPLTTRLREQDIYRCGDGVCQFTESCDDSRVGVGAAYNRCAADCGRCG